jgi:hypothetical protein
VVKPAWRVTARPPICRKCVSDTVHAVARIYKLLRNAALRPLLVRRQPVWEVVPCERVDAR